MPKESYIPQLGYEFNNWTVVDNQEPLRKGKHYTWMCQCKCGSISYLRSETIKNKRSNECNKCATKHKNFTLINKTHGKSRTKTWAIWQAMKQRCLNPLNCNYPNYGGRGITVCDRWLESFENLLSEGKNNVRYYEPFTNTSSQST
jgi:hypothetical protein